MIAANTRTQNATMATLMISHPAQPAPPFDHITVTISSVPASACRQIRSLARRHEDIDSRSVKVC